MAGICWYLAARVNHPCPAKHKVSEQLIAIEFHIQKGESEKAETQLITTVAQRAKSVRGEKVP